MSAGLATAGGDSVVARPSLPAPAIPVGAEPVVLPIEVPNPPTQSGPASSALQQPLVIPVRVGKRFPTAGGRQVLWVSALLVAVAMLVFSLSFLLVPKRASLKVISVPVAGALVFVDGEAVGKTPIRITGLEVGQYRVKIVAPGYDRYIQTIRIQTQQPHTMMVPLTATSIEPPPLDVPQPSVDAESTELK